MTTAQIRGRLDLDRDTYDALIAHARSDFPFEVCGLLARGNDPAQPVARHWRVTNTVRSMTYYSMDPKELLAAFNEMDDNDWELLAIYHSHPHTEAFPSPTDVELAYYPEAVYVLISLQDEQEPVVRGFDILDGTITERVLHVDGIQVPIGSR